MLPQDTIYQRHRHMVYTHVKQHEGLVHLNRCPDESLKRQLQEKYTAYQKRPLNKHDNFENLSKTTSFVEIVLSWMQQWQWLYGMLTVNATMVVNKNPPISNVPVWLKKWWLEYNGLIHPSLLSGKMAGTVLLLQWWWAYMKKYHKNNI